MNATFSFSGALYAQYYLESDRYISERMLKNVDKATSSIVENGLHQFYTSLSDFKQQLLNRNQLIQEEEEAVHALTMQQLQKILFYMLLHLCIGAIVFIAEIIISKWKKWRYNDNQHHHRHHSRHPRHPRLNRRRVRPFTV